MNTDVSFASLNSAMSSINKSELINEFEKKQTENKESTVNTFVNNLFNFANYTFYNTFSAGREIEIFYQQELILFGKTYYPLKDSLPLEELLADTIVFTYRSFFDPIIQNSVKYSDDCSWGCMIRSGQMLFAKAFQKHIASQGKSEYTNQQIISLFLDNPVTVVQNPYLHSYYTNFKENKTVYPPFSIQKITERTQKEQKGAGTWFSNFDIVNKMVKRMQVSDLFEDIEVFHLTQGLIEEDELIAACFEQVNCKKCKERDFMEDYVLVEFDGIKENKDFCLECLYLKKGNSVRMKKSGLIIVSLMLGLRNLTKSNKEGLLKFFEIQENMGMLGGRKNKGLYFVGTSKENLLYLDPHLNQPSIKDIVQIDEGTYDFQNMYEVDPNEITASFSLTFMFTNMKEYLRLRQDLKVFTESKEAFFKFKAAK